MFLALITVTSLALFFCPAFAEDINDNVSPMDSKIQRKSNFTELKNTKPSQNLPSGLKNLGTGMKSFFKDVSKTKGRTHEDNSNSSRKEFNGRSNKIIGSIVDFFKTTGTFISKVFNGIKSQNNVKRNKKEDTLQELPREQSENDDFNITVKSNESKSIHINSRYTYYDNKSHIHVNNTYSLQLNKVLISKEVLNGKLDDRNTVQSSCHKSNVYKNPLEHNITSKTQPLKHSVSSSEDKSNLNEHGSVQHSSHKNDVYKTDDFLLQQSKTEPSKQFVSSSEDTDKAFEDEQINRTPENSETHKYEFNVQTSENLQSNSIQDKVAEECTSKQYHMIRFMTHSEEYQRLWKPVLKLNEEERQAKMEKKYLSRTTSRNELSTHSEEYRKKWRPLIAQNMHLKPGRRLHPGRSYQRTTLKSVNHEGVTEFSDEKQSEVLAEVITDKCKNDVKIVSATEHSTLNSILTTSEATLTSDKSALKRKGNSSYLDNVDRNTRSNKERRKSEEDLLSSLSVEAFRPWAENRFQRVSNNIGLDQHYKTLGSKWGRAVSPLTPRPNNSRVNYDKMFP